MNAIVVEHVRVAELPLAWRERLANSESARVTLRIEAEAPVSATNEGFATSDPGIRDLARPSGRDRRRRLCARATIAPTWSRRFPQLTCG